MYSVDGLTGCFDPIPVDHFISTPDVPDVAYEARAHCQYCILIVLESSAHLMMIFTI